MECELPLIGAPQGQHNWWNKGLAGNRKTLRNWTGGWTTVKSVAQEGRKVKPTSPPTHSCFTDRKTSKTDLTSIKPEEKFSFLLFSPSSFSLSFFFYSFFLPSFTFYITFLASFYSFLMLIFLKIASYLSSNFFVPSSFLSSFPFLFLFPSYPSPFFFPSFSFSHR